MKKAVLFARFAGHDQLSNETLESQVKRLNEYAAANDLEVVKVIVHAGSSAHQLTPRLIAYLRKHPDVRIVVVEKTGSLCGNLHDFALLEKLVEEMGLETHLVQEGQLLRPGPKSQDNLLQNLLAASTENYIEIVRAEIIKGQTIKAEKGQYPGRTPFGYVRDRKRRTLAVHPSEGKVVELIFGFIHRATIVSPD